MQRRSLFTYLSELLGTTTAATHSPRSPEAQGLNAYVKVLFCRTFRQCTGPIGSRRRDTEYYVDLRGIGFVRPDPGSTSLRTEYIRYPTRCARGRGRNQMIHGLWLVVLTILALTAMPAAAAQADDIWTGAATSSAWSNATNWTAGVPPATAGTLTFPTVSGCAAPETCYTSKNDQSGISATGLVFSNTAGQYKLQGNSLTIGAGGITDKPGGSTGTVINAPLSLGAAQTWTVGAGSGSAYNSLSLTGGVTGSSSALSLAFPSAGFGDVYVDSDMEVGNVTVSGDGGLHVGGCPTCGDPGSVNGTNGHSVTINSGATLVANPSSTVGALSITGGKLPSERTPRNGHNDARRQRSSLDQFGQHHHHVHQRQWVHRRDGLLAAERDRQHLARRHVEGWAGGDSQWVCRAQPRRRGHPDHDDGNADRHVRQCSGGRDPHDGELVPEPPLRRYKSITRATASSRRWRRHHGHHDHAGDAEPIVCELQPGGHPDGHRDHERQRHRRASGHRGVRGQWRANLRLHEPAGQRQRIERDGNVTTSFTAGSSPESLTATFTGSSGSGQSELDELCRRR